MRYFLFLSSSHLLAISQNSTHATTAYIRNMKPYMKELALKPEEELEEEDLAMVRATVRVLTDLSPTIECS